MKTDTDDYSIYLEEKYLPGRDIYLHKLFYPRIFRELGPGNILDLGFGAGAFLDFMAKKNKPTIGIDSNQRFVDGAIAKGYDARLDDITKLKTIKDPVNNAVCDNVLEHLTPNQIEAFIKSFKSVLAENGRFIAIVPDAKGYEKDPTHQTFVTEKNLQPICAKHGMTIEKSFCYPFNSRWVGKHFYLNMQVFTITHA